MLSAASAVPRAAKALHPAVPRPATRRRRRPRPRERRRAESLAAVRLLGCAAVRTHDACATKGVVLSALASPPPCNG
eukprot:181739-Chlamydomonas_euryale.AAC.5